MKLCISQATILNNGYESDAEIVGRGGWHGVELWLTKLEGYLEGHTAAEARAVFTDRGVELAAAAGQGGLLVSRGAERVAHWGLYRRRLDLLASLGVPVLVVAADHGARGTIEEMGRAGESLAEAAELAGRFGVRLALEFQKDSPVCACLETALALVAQAGSENAGVCLDVFHYYTGPSKYEDLGAVTSGNLAWVQLSDLSGTLREFAGDGDRILPGDGDFQLVPLLDEVARRGYDGYVSLEVLNPHLWQVAADRVVGLAQQAMSRVAGRWLRGPVELDGGTRA
jgi:2-keto-myo-inositol isomerase